MDAAIATVSIRNVFLFFSHFENSRFDEMGCLPLAKNRPTQTLLELLTFRSKCYDTVV